MFYEMLNAMFYAMLYTGKCNTVPAALQSWCLQWYEISLFFLQALEADLSKEISWKEQKHFSKQAEALTSRLEQKLPAKKIELRYQ